MNTIKQKVRIIRVSFWVLCFLFYLASSPRLVSLWEAAAGIKGGDWKDIGFWTCPRNAFSRDSGTPTTINCQLVIACRTCWTRMWHLLFDHYAALTLDSAIYTRFYFVKTRSKNNVSWPGSVLTIVVKRSTFIDYNFELSRNLKNPHQRDSIGILVGL